MTMTAATLKAVALLGVTCVVLAAAALYLVFTEPVAVTAFTQTGDFSALFHVFTTALVGALRAAARFL
jgi:hypothetical protein